MRLGGWSIVMGLAMLAAGCSCGSAHELESDAAGPAVDAAPLADTAPRLDATLDAGRDAFVGPEDRFFTLEPAVVDLLVTNERCAAAENATTMLRVGIHYFSSCDTPGPIDVTLDAAAMTIALTPHVWHEHGRTDCRSIGAEYVRDVSIVGLTAGTWSVVGSATTTSLTVSSASVTCPPPGTGTITRGAMCQADCECLPGLACLAVRGDAACARFCADPCEPVGLPPDVSLSCASGQACASDPDLGWACAPETMDECDDARPCPAGMTCPPVSEGPRQCAWAISLNGSIRHACTRQSDCDPGLDCVQRADGQRACEVRCTTTDMACPSDTPHACMAGNWICEWLGE